MLSKLISFVGKFNIIIYIIQMIQNTIGFPWSVYNMHFLGYIYMCTDTLYFMWTIYKAGHAISNMM